MHVQKWTCAGGEILLKLFIEKGPAAGGTAVARRALPAYVVADADAFSFAGGVLGGGLAMLVAHADHVIAACKHSENCKQLQAALKNEILHEVVRFLDMLTDQPDRQHLRQKDYREITEAFEEADYLLLKHEHDAPPADAQQATWRCRCRCNCSCACQPFRWSWRVASRLWDGDVRAVRNVCATLGRFSDQRWCMELMHYAENAPAPCQRSIVQDDDDSDADSVPEDVFQDSNGHVSEIMQKLNNTEFSGIRSIGIIGMGGIGKTTTARHVFDQAQSKQMFDRCVWLTVSSDFAATATNTLLTEAFHELYPGISVPFHTAKDGLRILSELSRDGLPPLTQVGERKKESEEAQEQRREASKGVLLVLDDVWLNGNHAVVKDLNFATQPGVLADRSRLIVTTREEPTLSYSPGANAVMLMEELEPIPLRGLGDEAAGRLFDHHAFGDSVPIEVAEYLRDDPKKRFSSCEGNPLAIRVLGRALRLETTVARWAARLDAERAEEAEGSRRVSRICERSIIVLPPSLLECFIDCAAFAEDSPMEEAHLVYMFAMNPALGISNPANVRNAASNLRQLVSRSLLTKSTSGEGRRCYVMHGILRSIARCRSSPENSPGGRSFFSAASQQPPSTLRSLSSHSNAPLPKVLEDRKIERIDHMRTCVKNSAVYTNDHEWPDAPRLQYLWLHRRHVGFSTVESLPHSPRFRPRLMLKFLSLVWDDPRKFIYNTSHVVELEDFDMTKFYDQIPRSSSQCFVITAAWWKAFWRVRREGLVYLELRHPLIGLAAGLFPSFMRLRHLDLSSSGLLSLPEDIGECTQLETLYLHDVRFLQELPDSIGRLSNLKQLDLGRCWVLQSVPAAIRHCRKLQWLNMRACRSLEQLPESIGALPNLAHLDLSYCFSLKQLPDSLIRLRRTGKLKHLNLHKCISLEGLPRDLQCSTGWCPPQSCDAASRAGSTATSEQFYDVSEAHASELENDEDP